jgi:hypothetical protein
MDRPAGLPSLLGSFERHLHAANRADTTVATYLIAARQAEAFLRACGTELPEACRADLEAFMGDLLARRSPSTAATYHKVLRILYGWLEEEGRGGGGGPSWVHPPSFATPSRTSGSPRAAAKPTSCAWPVGAPGPCCTATALRLPTNVPVRPTGASPGDRL